MKQPIIRISLFAFLFVLVSMAPATKVKYTSAEGKLSITFPTTFESTNKDSEDYTSIQTQANLEDQLFFVAYNVHNSELSEHESLAQTSLSAFSEAMGGEITKQSDWKLKKNTGVKARIAVESNDLIGEYGAILVGQIQYQVAVVSAKSAWNQARSDAFFKSFKLKK